MQNFVAKKAAYLNYIRTILYIKCKINGNKYNQTKFKIRIKV